MTSACVSVDAFGQGVPGLDALRIPMPDSGFRSDACRSHQLPGWAPTPAGDPSTVARYRWWVGHQTTFCVWRLLADCLSELAGAQRTSGELVEAAALMYNVYSLLLVYSGSCSPDQYETVIRPEMAKADTAFTGRWARDFERIPALLREVKRTHPKEALASLTAASKANLLVHVAVARRLVRGGESLLRMSDQHVGSVVTDVQRDLFDAYFHVQRTEVCGREFAMQLLRLCTVVLDDLDALPLAQRADWSPAGVAESDAVARCLTGGSTDLWNLLTSSYFGRLLS